MRILHLTDRLSARGGADWHLLGVLAELGRDHEQLLAVGRDDGSAIAPCPMTLIRGLEDPRRGAPARSGVPRGDRSPPAAQRGTLTGLLDRLADHLEPDVIHIHNAVGPEALAWAADHGAVMTVQDHRCFCPGQGKLTLDGQVCREPLNPDRCASCFEHRDYGDWIYAVTAQRLEAVRRMARLTVLSAYMKAELVQVGLDSDRVHVVRPLLHGLDPAAPPAGPPCVLFAGRLVSAKGVADALEAWRRSGVALPLVLAGTGSQRAPLEAQGAAVLGWLAHDELSAVYRRARAVLLCSRWQEPLGIVGPEALSLGVPVVAWNSGAVQEWHPAGPRRGPEHALVGWGDVEALAQALRLAVVAAPGSCTSPSELQVPRGFETPELMARLLQVYRAGAGG